MYFRRDTSLTEKGREQARKASEKVGEYDPDQIYHSPLERAAETAKIIADELGVQNLIPDQRLIERDFGILTGEHARKVPELADKTLKKGRICYCLEGEGIEEFPEVYERVNTFLKDIQEKHVEDTVVIVTHGDAGKMVQAAYNELHWKEGLEPPYIENAEVRELS